VAGVDICPVCGSKMGDDAKACSICGTAFEQVSYQCPLCGGDVGVTDEICHQCGADLVPVSPGKVDEIDNISIPSDEERGVAEEIATAVFVDVKLEELVKLPGVGPLRAKILFDAGYTDLRKLKQASVVELMNIRGIGRKAAGEIKSALRELTLEQIRETPLTEETIGAEHQCPLCATIVSAYESSCYECGCIFKAQDLGDDDSDRLALSYYDSKLLRAPDSRDLWYARGATLVKMGNYEQALNSYNRAIDIDPSFQTAWMSKAEVYNKLGDSAKAAECYSHIITTTSGGHIPGTEMEIPDKLDDKDNDDLNLEPPKEPEVQEADESVVGEPSVPVVQERIGPVVQERFEPTAQGTTEPEAPVPSEPVPEQIPETAEPVPEITPAEDEPELNVQQASSVMTEIHMDYQKQVEKPDYDSMTEEELKKELSRRATRVKPYLKVAREAGVDINHAKRLVSRAVSESKQNEYKVAVQLMDEGIEFAETEFRKKISVDIENLASVVRDLKIQGKNMSAAAFMITESKELLDSGEIVASIEKLKACLEYVEIIAS